MQYNLTKQLGTSAEEMAIKFLQEAGFVIVERNYYARKFGEIDIIAHKTEIWHFIEVKSSFKNFDPIYNLSKSKMKRIINSTHYYLKSNNLNVEFCIDALMVRNGEIEFIENITL